MKMFGGGAEILGVDSGVWKIGEVKGEGVKPGYRTNGLITWARLARFAEIAVPYYSYKRNKNQLCDFMTTEPARLVGIPVCDAGDPGWKLSKLSRLPGSPANEPTTNEPSEKQHRG